MPRTRQYSNDRTKQYVIAEFGRPLASRSDCEQLSLEILNKTGQLVSYNTLRRIFGLAGKQNGTNTTLTILNVLANYCGFQNYYQLELGVGKENPSVEKLYFLLQKYQLQGKIDIHEVNELIDRNSMDDNAYIFFHQLVLLALLMDDVEFLTRLFAMESFFYKREFIYTHLFFTVLTLGTQIRFKAYREKLWKSWAESDIALNFYFELFVDMDCLINSHFHGLEFYRSSKKTPEARLFSSCLLYLRAFMLEDEKLKTEEMENVLSVKVSKDTHPIPIARKFIALMLLESETLGTVSKALKENILDLENQIGAHGVAGKLNPIFHYWILEGLVIVGEYEFAEQIVQLLEKKYNILDQSYFNIGSLERLKTYKGLINVGLNRVQVARAYFSSIDADSYYPFSHQYDRIFYHALDYRLDKNESTLTTAKILADKIGYSKLLGMLIAS